MIMGYSGQNPYVMTYGQNIWQEKFAKEKRAGAAGSQPHIMSEEERSRRREERERREEDKRAENGEGGAAAVKGRSRLGDRINEVILRNEEQETMRLLGDDDREDMV